MRRFIKNIVAFAAVQTVVVAALIVLFPGHSSTYLAATIDKHRAAETKAPPRMIHVGGSSAAFGFDCPRIEEATGMGQVNLALHIGLGLEFILAEALDVVRPGDVVVLHVEYEQIATRPIDFSTIRGGRRHLRGEL